MFYLGHFPASNFSRLHFTESFELSTVFQTLCSFIPLSPGGAELLSRWFMSAQDLSKEQLAHFPTAQVVGICFSHCAFLFFLFFVAVAERHFLPTVNATQTSGSWNSCLSLESASYVVVVPGNKILSCRHLGWWRHSQWTLKQDGCQDYIKSLLFYCNNKYHLSVCHSDVLQLP